MSTQFVSVVSHGENDYLWPIWFVFMSLYPFFTLSEQWAKRQGWKARKGNDLRKERHVQLMFISFGKPLCLILPDLVSLHPYLSSLVGGALNGNKGRNQGGIIKVMRSTLKVCPLSHPCDVLPTICVSSEPRYFAWFVYLLFYLTFWLWDMLDYCVILTVPVPWLIIFLSFDFEILTWHLF